jgi:hypothetical protein
MAQGSMLQEDVDNGDLRLCRKDTQGRSHIPHHLGGGIEGGGCPLLGGGCGSTVSGWNA